jgi:GT2 family glycosyltransferase
MNRGLREARGEIVLFLDDDIVPSPNLIEAHREAYERYPEAWAVAGRVLQPEDGKENAETLRSEAGKTPGENGKNVRFFSLSAFQPFSFLREDLDFRFNGRSPAWVTNVMAGNLSVRRARALAVGGFDENFIPPVSFRFETEFAKRLVAAGGRIRFEPAAEIRHLRAARGGTRSIGSHLASASPLHGVGDYYYALRCGRGWDRWGYMVRRPFREVCTQFHLRHPWWIPVKFVGECRALALALRLRHSNVK